MQVDPVSKIFSLLEGARPTRLERALRKVLANLINQKTCNNHVHWRKTDDPE
jgi:hypothetical protein